MLQAWIAAILMVVGMIAMFINPIVGGILITIGYLLYKNTDKATRAAAESTFWGFALLCMVVVGVTAVFNL